MLIDDDHITNFLNQEIIEELEVCENLSCYQNPLEALKDITTRISNSSELPDYIFLDLNMPKLNGWGFLDTLINNHDENKLPLIYILTTSINPDDKAKSSNYSCIKGFYNKPLNEILLEQLLKYKN